MAKTQMLINYAPGDECRIAIVEDGKLEEFEFERSNAVSRVGNIYAGVVTNVEPAIQAAFVEFGVENQGFLHITDLHPRFFPGESKETTERVGKKIPRRERPPIQQCLQRGQEIAVQVLKEGIGTKGPTLTGYLSIPGRYLVMMPQMDRVGVSRKVEDDDLRRKTRQVLDQLELPDGFGFIVRTAGLDKNKTELKRDLAYLQRLWKDIEARHAAGKKPRLLYSESDLLVRALRDLLTSDIDEVVIDNEQALDRAARFLKIVAPRSQTELLHYDKSIPLFHSFGVEQQIANMHASEVPLPSGGRLVIDETEALVAIDVNSGKSRSARDAETNAYKTNVEATEEICRQLRLRDLGGLVICDLIDMREGKHRRDIEHRFRERLKRDRAKSTILPISTFGILEMTRQRMHGSHEAVHFSDCPTCRGRGLVQRPDSVAADALRNLSAVLDHERVQRVEMVVGPRVAGELLSTRRQALSALEAQSGKNVDVRVSETVAVDRVAFYLYDSAGADVAMDRLPAPKSPGKLIEWKSAAADDWAIDPKEEAAPKPTQTQTQAPRELIPGEEEEEDSTEQGTKKKRRRRRRRRKSDSDTTSESTSSEAPQPESAEQEPQETPQPEATTEQTTQQAADSESTEAEPSAKKKRRRRRRSKKAAQSSETTEAESHSQEPAPAAPPPEPTAPSASSEDSPDSEDRPKKKRRSRRKKTTSASSADQPTDQPVAEATPAPSEPAKKKTRSRKKTATSDSTTQIKPETAPKEPAPAKRTLYASRRKLGPSERARSSREE